jgi:thiamine-phosphate pyrophosphorylase
VTARGLRERLQLIVITDPAAPSGVPNAVAAAVRAGAGAIQLRWKGGGSREMVELGRRILPSVRAAGALLFVNDRIDVALAVGADGVHLGEDDLPLEAARRIVPEGFLIGKSADTPDEVAGAERAGADYVAIGPVFPTGSKPDAGSVVGIAGVARARAGAQIPLIGIGGIDASRAAQVLQAGADGVAVIGAVMFADDPLAATGEILQALRRQAPLN